MIRSAGLHPPLLLSKQQLPLCSLSIRHVSHITGSTCLHSWASPLGPIPHPIFAAKEANYAGKRSRRQGRRRSPGREGAVHGRRRIRSRRDRTREGREARRTFATTGNRNRAEQGSTGRHSACASQARKDKRGHAKERRARLQQRTIRNREEGIGQAVARDRKCPEKGTALDGFAQGSFWPRQESFEVTLTTPQQPACR